MVGYGDYPLRDVGTEITNCWNCKEVAFHTVVYPTYHGQESVSSINLTFRKNNSQI